VKSTKTGLARRIPIEPAYFPCSGRCSASLQRTGDAAFQTTQGYMREAEDLGARFGAVLPAVPDIARSTNAKSA
jgi:hypothetical protein